MTDSLIKLIIAGSRDLTVTSEFIEQQIVKFNLSPYIVISGGANGIDRCGELFAKKLGLNLMIFEANWELHGKSAGPLRNQQMAKEGDALLLIWDGKSRGSNDMRSKMIALNKPIYEVIIERE